MKWISIVERMPMRPSDFGRLGILICEPKSRRVVHVKTMRSQPTRISHWFTIPNLPEDVMKELGK